MVIDVEFVQLVTGTFGHSLELQTLCVITEGERSSYAACSGSSADPMDILSEVSGKFEVDYSLYFFDVKSPRG